MSQKFEDQGGFATSNPPAPVRWISSKVMSWLISQSVVDGRRRRAERARKRRGEPHRIEYFHQVEDAYSHLAAQLLRPLLERYDVELVPHLVTVERDANLPEPELLPKLARHEAAKLAPYYGLRFAADAGAPGAERVQQARAILAEVAPSEFPEAAVAVGDALWQGSESELAALAQRWGAADVNGVARALEQGGERRAAAGHYSGGMFLHNGEWYWGADRMYLLEERLAALGARRPGVSGDVCARPEIALGPLRDDGSLTLEIYPSLRSPYTAVIFDAAVELVRETGVRSVTRPVLPMVMRGVPATRQKGVYIFTDAAREAAALGRDFGPVYDPIGDPVRRAYSLWPWACAQGRGDALLQSFLQRAFYEGVNTGSDKGLRRVVEAAGLPWSEAEPIVGNDDWEAEIEANRLAMLEMGCWGVPSFRLLDRAGNEVLAVWGQDRLWLVALEIQRLLAAGGVDDTKPAASTRA
ncbi:MAG: DsbA family protein [Myxococcota bacterium]